MLVKSLVKVKVFTATDCIAQFEALWWWMYYFWSLMLQLYFSTQKVALDHIFLICKVSCIIKNKITNLVIWFNKRWFDLTNVDLIGGFLRLWNSEFYRSSPGASIILFLTLKMGKCSFQIYKYIYSAYIKVEGSRAGAISKFRPLDIKWHYRKFTFLINTVIL